ncbi:hypothetical protein K470DRAFT_263665 [Piedraia hortae CBS 480.64]|uniref:Uncharacterized protein n=1 Tax=Piedraia hortae CBS 480.64 TaxID=1314780 RepID=A0A6A7C235_9PEZI|nr:hypothetical protein K470DRAFT_263665 [Piedraia hortae CBS 480.64]
MSSSTTLPHAFPKPFASYLKTKLIYDLDLYEHRVSLTSNRPPLPQPALKLTEIPPPSLNLEINAANLLESLANNLVCSLALNKIHEDTFEETFHYACICDLANSLANDLVAQMLARKLVRVDGVMTCQYMKVLGDEFAGVLEEYRDRTLEGVDGEEQEKRAAKKKKRANKNRNRKLKKKAAKEGMGDNEEDGEGGEEEGGEEDGEGGEEEGGAADEDADDDGEYEFF